MLIIPDVKCITTGKSRCIKPIIIFIDQIAYLVITWVEQSPINEFWLSMK